MDEIIANKYRVISKCGSDSFSEHFRCSRDDVLTRTIIVKRVFPPLATNSRLISRVRESVLRFAKPIHTNVVRVSEFIQTDTDVFYTVEDFGGADICDWCEKRRPINEIVTISNQVAEGLSAVHAAGIIHRNIKPEVAFCSSQLVAKLGESIISADSTNKDQNNTDGMVGEADLIPPEYLQYGEHSHVGDIYSLGTLAFETIT